MGESLAVRPISAVDLSEEWDGFWLWGFMPLLAGAVHHVMWRLGLSGFGVFNFMSYEHIWIVSLIVYLPFAIAALWVARRFRQPAAPFSRRVNLIICASLAIIFLAELIEVLSLGTMRAIVGYKEVQWSVGLPFGLIDVKVFLPAAAYLTLRETCFRGIVMGAMLTSGATRRSAIITSTALDFITVFLITWTLSLINLMQYYGTDAALFLIPGVVGSVLVIVTGFTFSWLRASTGKLWPCIAVALLCSFLVSGINFH